MNWRKAEQEEFARRDAAIAANKEIEWTHSGMKDARTYFKRRFVWLNAMDNPFTGSVTERAEAVVTWWNGLTSEQRDKIG